MGRLSRKLLGTSLLAAVLASGAGAARLGDFDGDGKADVLLRHADGSWRYHALDGASVATGARVHMTRRLEWYWAGAGDFNGDGSDDVMLRRDDGVWVYYPLDGSRVIAAEHGWANLTRKLDWHVVGVGDFNADGRDDVLMQRTDGAWVYYPMNGRRVIAEEHGWANLPRDADWRMAGVGDFDGDGRDDVLLRHVIGVWRAYAMDGRRTGNPLTTTLPADRHWDFAGVGDFDGDGRDDVLLRHAGGQWQHRPIDGSPATGLQLDRDWAWRLSGIGDTDGDGRDDVLLRHADGRWQWNAMDGDGTARQAELAFPHETDWRLPGRPVFIPDVGLRRAVTDALGKTAGEFIRPREALRLAALDAGGAGIVDLTGIGAATGLVEVDLRTNGIRNLWPLVGIVGLRTLDLYRNRIPDASPLAHLPALEELSLGANAIDDLGPLTGPTGLRILDLRFNDIRDIAPLAALDQLVRLNAAGNRIGDVSALASLNRLERLDLHLNGIADIGPLRRLTHLTELYLGGNRVADIAPLTRLTALTRLGLSDNRIEDISPLGGLTELTWLWLSGNEVADWSPLQQLAGLTALGLRDNHIDDLSPLADLNALRHLWLSNNVIEDISPLAGLGRLVVLFLDRNRIADIGPVRNLTRLRELYFSRNRVSELSPLEGLTALTRLSLNDNDIEDVSSLAGLTALTRLWLRNNRIADVSPLAGLTRLALLDLDQNRVVEVAALANLTSLDVLHLASNRIVDLAPLVNNAGLGDGDFVDLRSNPLSGESAATGIDALVARGVRVESSAPEPEPEPPEPEPDANTDAPKLELVHDDSVIVMRIPEDIRSAMSGDGLRLHQYMNVVYSHFEDSFDFVMFLSNLDSFQEHENLRYLGIYNYARNDTTGTGLQPYYDNRYGSAERLRGVMHFPYNRAIRDGPSLHELMHAWANYAVPTTSRAHWGFSSANGQLGGFDRQHLVDLGDNRYAARPFRPNANGGNRLPYSPIELYFAGYLPPEEVPDLWVAEDGEWVLDDGVGVETDDGRWIFSASTVRTYSINDIVAEHGARRPSMGAARWHFRVAVVLLTDADHPETAEQLDRLSEQAAWFSQQASDTHSQHNYYEATGGRGSVTTDGVMQFWKATPSAVRDLPASFGVVPASSATMPDGRCLPISAVRIDKSLRHTGAAGTRDRSSPARAARDSPAVKDHRNLMFVRGGIRPAADREAATDSTTRKIRLGGQQK